MKRVVLDTNVFVSAVLGGMLEPILDGWQTGKFAVVVSDEIVREYLTVLQRPKFGLSGKVIDTIAAFIFHKAIFITPLVSMQIIQSDPSDDKFLEAAVSGEADCIVSGDKHLLAIKHFRDVYIISARQFIEQLGK